MNQSVDGTSQPFVDPQVTDAIARTKPCPQINRREREPKPGRGQPGRGRITERVPCPSPANNAWNTDISGAAVDPNSDAPFASIGLTRGLHPDFGSGLWDGAPIGIPYVVVEAPARPRWRSTSPITATRATPAPIRCRATPPSKGRKADGSSFGGDRHVLVVDRDANRLYELYNAFPQANGGWNASSAAWFHLDSNNVRPTAQPGWTSADAAGLPIFPGLVRYDEASQLAPSAMPALYRGQHAQGSTCRRPRMGQQRVPTPICPHGHARAS